MMLLTDRGYKTLLPGENLRKILVSTPWDFDLLLLRDAAYLASYCCTMTTGGVAGQDTTYLVCHHCNRPAHFGGRLDPYEDFGSLRVNASTKTEPTGAFVSTIEKLGRVEPPAAFLAAFTVDEEIRSIQRRYYVGRQHALA